MTREEVLEEALRKILEWNDFPEAFDFNGNPSTYGFEYGSNGERDYMRNIAQVALLTKPQ